MWGESVLRAPHFGIQLIYLVVLLLCGGALRVHAYTPAQASNASLGTGTGAADSSLDVFWFPKGTSSQIVNYQLAGTNSSGLTTAPLVQFEEQGLTNDTTTTPWIALISCDKKNNDTTFDPNTDIFTLAQERGALAALLYSNTSQTCVINEEYLNETEFERLIDIYAVEAIIVTQMIYSLYNGLTNFMKYESFNATLLNETAAVVNRTIKSQSLFGPGFLYARLAAFNTTSSTNSSGSSSGGGPGPGGGGTPSTGLAMIVLYSITGVVSALFCVVIVTGVIRAIRHPERYTGPQAFGGGPNGPSSRRTVITRAILDTFPIIKFNRGPVVNGDTEAGGLAADKGVEGLGHDRRQSSGSDVIKMHEFGGEGSQEGENPTPAWLAPLVQRSQDDIDIDFHLPALHSDDDHFHGYERQASGSKDIGTPPSPSSPAQSPASRALPTSAQAVADPVMPEAIGRETCPICIVDFEEGDDLRVLPCEGKHQFHQQCVDPWLLELSGSCPLCRQDFATLETMMEGTPEDPRAYRVSAARGVSAHHQGPPRLSQYIRFAQRRRNRNNRTRDDRPISSYQHTTEDIPPSPSVPLSLALHTTGPAFLHRGSTPPADTLYS